MNLPNALTVLRIFLVPVLVVVLLTRARTDEGLILGMAIFGLAVLTDYLDGYFARRRNQVTQLGHPARPHRGQAAHRGRVPVPGRDGRGPAWMVMIILGREFAVTGLRNVAAGRGLPDPGLRPRQGEDGGAGGGDLPAAAAARALRVPAAAGAWPRCGWSSSWPSSPASTTSGASTARSIALPRAPTHGRSPPRPWPPRPP